MSRGGVNATDTNRPVRVRGPVLRIGRRESGTTTCRDEVAEAMVRLKNQTGEDAFTAARVFADMSSRGTSYKESTVSKTRQRMKGTLTASAAVPH